MENDNLNIEELLVLYAIGSLEPEEVSAVEDELKKHPELMAQVEKYRRTDSLLSAVFAQSDAAVQQTIAEESAKPKFAGKTETSQSSLARRFAFSVAALALILVVGVLLYPQFGRNDVQVALTNQDDNNNSASENVKMEDANSSVGQAPDQHIVMSEENPQIASGVNIFEKSLPDDLEDDANTGMAEDLNPAPMIAQDTIEAENAPDAESPEAQFSMRNALYNVPGQKTDDGMAPMRLVQNSRVKGIDESAPAPGSYVVLQKSVMEENRLPNPESVKVKQWLNYFGVAELVNTTEDKNEEADKKDVQFANAMNQFATLLSSSEPADVKAFEEVLDLLKDTVGDDAKRQEFKAIVEKTIEIVKKLSE